MKLLKIMSQFFTKSCNSKYNGEYNSGQGTFQHAIGFFTPFKKMSSWSKAAIHCWINKSKLWWMRLLTSLQIVICHPHIYWFGNDGCSASWSGIYFKGHSPMPTFSSVLEIWSSMNVKNKFSTSTSSTIHTSQSSKNLVLAVCCTMHDSIPFKIKK